MHLTRLLSFFCLVLLLGSSLPTNGQSDDSPGFFLKITKNVPRLGRRSDKEYENYFLKNMKTIPRIGRSTRGATEAELIAWLGNDSPAPGKRALQAAPEREYSVVQPVNSDTLIKMLDKDEISHDKVKFVHWKDFDRALQFDTELYAKLLTLGRKPDQRLKADLSFNGFVPLFGNSNDGDADFMLYNQNGDRELYSGRYDRDFLHYNHLN